MTQTGGTPVLVGLTGGIASGKSTVSRALAELGVAIIDADVIAREVVEPGEPALDEIAARFGDGVIAADGRLDREALGRVIFGDDEARRELGYITHPRIGQRMWQRAEEAGAAGHRWVIYDAALIVENGLHHMLDALIVVNTSAAVQRARLMARDGVDAAAADARIASQLPLSEKLKHAHYIIDNDGTLEETLAQVRALHAQIEAAVTTRHTARPEEVTP